MILRYYSLCFFLIQNPNWLRLVVRGLKRLNLFATFVCVRSVKIRAVTVCASVVELKIMNILKFLMCYREIRIGSLFPQSSKPPVSIVRLDTTCVFQWCGWGQISYGIMFTLNVGGEIKEYFRIGSDLGLRWWYLRLREN